MTPDGPPRLTLAIEPDLCGPVSVGTVRVILLLREHLALDLDLAVSYVNRCVFDGEQIEIPAPSRGAAERLVAALGHFPRARARALGSDAGQCAGPNISQDGPR